MNQCPTKHNLSNNNPGVKPNNPVVDKFEIQCSRNPHNPMQSPRSKPNV